MARHSPKVALLSAVLFGLLSGCELPLAHGDANALIVAADQELWAEAEGVFRDAMEPTIQTVRDERPFRITHQQPSDTEAWGRLRRFRQVLVLGDAGDPWVQEVVAALASPPPSPPAIAQAHDVWARGQIVSLLLLPETGQAEAVASIAGELHDLLDAQYRQYAQQRMFVSGMAQDLSDSLATHVGFSLSLPSVYSRSIQDSVFRFRNDNPSPAELIREIGVTWQSPIPESLPARHEMEAWRQSFSAAYYNDAQLIDTTLVSYGPVEVDGLIGVEFQSAWVSLPDAWPAGGPFISRALLCPSQERLYLLDAWLYAPNRDKYEYMIQLQTILDSFRCST